MNDTFDGYIPVSERVVVTYRGSALLPGSVIAQFKRCGKPNCRCISGRQSDLHGPYYYRYFREAGRLRRQYVKKSDLSKAREEAAAFAAARWEVRSARRRSEIVMKRARVMLRNMETDIRAMKEGRNGNR